MAARRVDAVDDVGRGTSPVSDISIDSPRHGANVIVRNRRRSDARLVTSTSTNSGLPSVRSTASRGLRYHHCLTRTTCSPIVEETTSRPRRHGAHVLSVEVDDEGPKTRIAEPISLRLDDESCL